MGLALLVEVQTDAVELLQDILRGVVLDDAALLVEQLHIGGGDGGLELELANEPILLLLVRIDRILAGGDGEGDRGIGMVLLKVLDINRRLGLLLAAAISVGVLIILTLLGGGRLAAGIAEH